MPEIESAMKVQVRRELGARLARAALVLGFAGWLACLAANLLFNPMDKLFFASVVGAALFSAGIVLRGLQLVYPRRFPRIIKIAATLFLVIFAYGVLFGLVLLSNSVMPESLLEQRRGTNE
ncbi:MAG: hypothetical protein KDB07_04630 [Planctomycetes bacterium]|nr:hypothetical protein [Planctomycetota bacterium]